MTSTLFLCGSIKPAPDHDVRSASRELLKLVVAGHEAVGTPCTWFDLREKPLPFYDGRFHHEYDHANLTQLVAAIAGCSQIVISVPAYWGAAAGGIKNALDLVGGPLYDNPDGETPLNGKRVHLLIVGASDRDAWLTLVQMRTTFHFMGAAVADDAVVVGNLRHSSAADRKALGGRLYQWGRDLASYTAPPVEVRA